MNKNIAVLSLLLLSGITFAQVDIIKVVKEEKNSILFASVLDQVISAKATKEEITEYGRLYVNDSIVVTSYWFTCYSLGAQHQRLEAGEHFSSQTIWDLNHVGKGGKAYFTNISGYSIYTREEYRIYSLEIMITD